MNKKIVRIFLRRVLSSAVVLFLLITFIFFLVRISPGDPSQRFISPAFSPQLAESVRQSFRLDEPLFNQYTVFIRNFAAGDLGISYNYRRPVLFVIGDFLPFTVTFALVSFALQLLISISLAYYTVKRKNSLTDKIVSGTMLAAYATPVFVAGVILIYIFSVQLNLFPSSGIAPIDVHTYGFFRKILAYAHHLFLPFIALSMVEVAILYKYLRDNLNDVFNKTFILNLRANGIKEKTILLRHVIPNAANPLISVTGIELGILFGGTLIVEVIFGLPGMGRLTIEAILTRDYPLVIGCTLIAGVLMIFSNLTADIVRAKIDKRVLIGALN